MASSASSHFMPRVLALAGSMRADSFNRKLLRVAVGIAGEAGVEIDLAELRELELPLYDGDLEANEGLPESVVRFQERIRRAEGLLLACPEYNHSIPGAFKNAIDWASRPPGNPFPHKVAALLGASPGAAGALRALMQLRWVLTSRGVWVVPAQVTVSHADKAFDEAGALKDPALHKQVAAAVQQLLLQIRRVQAVPM
jgi:chromate reductase